MRDRPREGKMERRRGAGKRRASVGRVLKSLENCGHDCGNPVICGAKAGHSSDLGAQMLSFFCLFCSCSFHSRLPSLPIAPYLTLFSQLHWMSGGWSWLSLTLNSQSSHTPAAISNSVRTKGFFLSPLPTSCNHLNFSPISCILMFPQLFGVNGGSWEKRRVLSGRNGNTIFVPVLMINTRLHKLNSETLYCFLVFFPTEKG